MSKQFKIGFIVVFILVMVFIVWMFSEDKSTNKARRPFVSSNWSKKFQMIDKDPLGLYLFNSLAQTHLDSTHKLIEIKDWVEFDTLIKKNDEKKTFLFIGNNFGLKNSEIDTLLSYVQGGSDLFLSYNDLTENLYPILFKEYKTKFEYSSEINVFIPGAKYRMINLFQNDTVACDWKSFSNSIPHGNYKSLSSFMEMSNFIQVDLGKGKLFLNSNPTLFYNYQIKRPQGYKYTEYVLNQLPQDQDIYLLELGRLSDNYGNQDTDETDGADGKRDDSYLKLIFENTTLLVALLLSILGVVLFVVFRSKRTQPIVPFKADKKDMTIAFAETITSIYFAKRNPYGLLQVQRKNFYSTVHKYFFVDLQRRESDKALETLAEKSDTPKEEIESLIQGFETKEAFSVSEEFVADILRKQHDFYRRVGIISSELDEKVKNRELIFKRALWLPSILILGGLSVIFLGVFYLVSSIGIGVVLIPIGGIFLILGSLRITYPYLQFNGREIVHYSQFGRKQVYQKDDLITVEIKSSGTILHFKNDKWIINNWDLSRFDKKQFKRFISSLHKNEL